MLFKPTKIKTLIIKAIIIVVILAIFLVLMILKNNRDICEQYSRTVQRGYLFLFGHITSWIPFSVMEVLVLGLGIFVLFDLVRSIICFVTLRPLKAISKLLTIGIIAASMVTLFTASFSLGYNRYPLELETYEGEIKQEDLKPIVQYFLDDFNECANKLEYKENGEVKSPYSLSEIQKILVKEYDKLDNPYLMKYTTSLKPLMTSFLFRELNITGITFGITGEANINTLSTASEIPFVAAHELAHTKGVMPEREADYLAAYITLNSDDYFLRYSGYMFSFSRILSIAEYTGNNEDYGELSSQVSPKIRANSSYISKYWKDHDMLAKFEDWLNNLYLKNNGIEEGTANYGDSSTTIDEEEKKITELSNYQKIYFKIYYDNLNI